MGFFEAVRTTFLQKYATFEGRACRSEYWYAYLFSMVFGTALMVLSGVAKDSLIALAIIVIVAIAMILPGIAVTVRRLHDTDRSGWSALISFVPVIGGIMILIWTCSRGTIGVNRFGSDPLSGV
ncbi:MULTISPECIES: DUF805 domain-containing protein [unclassified Caballeronia]|uniref:DUF805 domain-containing protein n=1 Tax=unclassified Caballeronia TaxID=2646786 RepID=UPI002857A072|nr:MULTISPECIES: DUF805 domain-containing protein [unclassified Caballeronia]MDR5736673.1 DUF805 domain-containing protein [Caballeronia sp. LZ016]MDR5810846.1 DUF805 domain-containing protein [Caballeronia sp. LZ019]